MLETPASLDFLYQVAYSPRITSRQGLSKRGRPCKEFGWSEPPPVTGRQMAKMALRRLSHSLTFMIGDSNVNPEVEDSFAVTIPTLTGFSKGVKMNEASSLMGSAGRIIVNEDYLLMLRDLDIQKENTTSQRMSLQVKMAITLCHEISVSLFEAYLWRYLKSTQCGWKIFHICSDVLMLTLRHLARPCNCSGSGAIQIDNGRTRGRRAGIQQQNQLSSPWITCR